MLNWPIRKHCFDRFLANLSIVYNLCNTREIPADHTRPMIAMIDRLMMMMVIFNGEWTDSAPLIGSTPSTSHHIYRQVIIKWKDCFSIIPAIFVCVSGKRVSDWSMHKPHIFRILVTIDRFDLLYISTYWCPTLTWTRSRQVNNNHLALCRPPRRFIVLSLALIR